MVPKEYPPQQTKTEAVISRINALMRHKSEAERIAAGLPGKLAAAIERSNRVMAEDIVREAGYMLPQSDNVRKFLQSLLEQDQPEGFPAEVVKKLLATFNKEEDKEMGDHITLDNLMEAFAGESQANRKYLAYARKAEKEGKCSICGVPGDRFIEY